MENEYDPKVTDGLIKEYEDWVCKFMCGGAPAKPTSDQLYACLYACERERARLAKECAELRKDLRRFFEILDVVEESDEGREFHPTRISCCRAFTSVELASLLAKLREQAREKEKT